LLIVEFPINNQKSRNQQLLHFFMRRMLPATLAEFFQLDTIRSRLPVLRGRIVPLFAITALHRNNFSGHCSLPVIAEGGFQNAEVVFALTSAFLLLTSDLLLHNFRNRARAHRVAAFTNREA
jgi:hypothetical protein